MADGSAAATVVVEQLCDQGMVDQKSSNKSWFSLSGVVW